MKLPLNINWSVNKISYQIAWLLSSVFFLLALLQITENISEIIKSQILQDFFVYYKGVEFFFLGQNPYQEIIHTAGPMQFIYPPATLIFFLPLLLLPIQTMQVIFIVISTIAFIFSLWLARKLFDLPFTPITLISCALLLQTFPAKFGLAMGQINFILLLMIISSLWLHKKNQILFAAFLLAAATVFKFIPVFLLPAFLIRKQWRFLKYWLLFVLIPFVLTPSLTLHYITTVFSQLTAIRSFEMPVIYDQSILALLLRLGIPSTVASLVYVVSVTLLIGWVTWKFRASSIYYSSVLLLAVASISFPHSWQHYLIFAYPLIISWLNIFQLIIVWPTLVFHIPENRAIVPPSMAVLASYQTLLIVAILYIADAPASGITDLRNKIKLR